MRNWQPSFSCENFKIRSKRREAFLSGDVSLDGYVERKRFVPIFDLSAREIAVGWGNLFSGLSILRRQKFQDSVDSVVMYAGEFFLQTFTGDIAKFKFKFRTASFSIRRLFFKWA